MNREIVKRVPFTSLNEVMEKLKRESAVTDQLLSLAAGVFKDVGERGDKAVREYTSKYDGVEISGFRVTEAMMDDAERLIPDELKRAIAVASANIEKFHAAQKIPAVVTETMPGVKCWQRQVPVGSVGLYIPGGRAPLFSTVLMLALPAVIAGCREIVLVTPPGRNGIPHPAILYSARVAGVKAVYMVGGMQAIAAMALGTETIPAVNKIFGPGNSYVTAAKQYASALGVAVDIPAGPSEVMVVADGSANPRFVAADLLSQAEHGPDSQSVLVTTSASFADEVYAETERQLETLPERETALSSLAGSAIVVVSSEREMLQVINSYAPEHLILQVPDAAELAMKVESAGSVFIGPWTPESAGDYASGTNHTLPTNGFAAGWSGVTLDSFMKRITYQEITADGLSALSETITVMARAESLEGHARAVDVRMESLNEIRKR
jgi:histidinol dehydrogenase